MPAQNQTHTQARALAYTPQDTHAAHPDDLHGHTGLGGTVALTLASVATFALGLQPAVHARTRVDSLRLADDQTILDQLAHALACGPIK